MNYQPTEELSPAQAISLLGEHSLDYDATLPIHGVKTVFQEFKVHFTIDDIGDGPYVLVKAIEYEEYDFDTKQYQTQSIIYKAQCTQENLIEAVKQDKPDSAYTITNGMMLFAYLDACENFQEVAMKQAGVWS